MLSYLLCFKLPRIPVFLHSSINIMLIAHFMKDVNMVNVNIRKNNSNVIV